MQQLSDSLDDYFSPDINHFVKTISAIQTKGVRPDLIGSIITNYASKFLPDLSSQHDTATWNKTRFHVEALVGVLPVEKGSVTCDFLLKMIRVANMVGTEPDCRAELERRIMWQLEEASIQDILIPSFNHTCGTLLDVALVIRLVKGFVNLEEANSTRSGAAVAKVAKLVDSYLAEAAIDSNLNMSDFLALAGALPAHSRISDDGLYRAIDTYFKSHPGLSKQERKTLCRLLDSRKLSHEASLHAIQNERLPTRAVLLILFSEQAKLHRHLDWSASLTRGMSYIDPEQTPRCVSKRYVNHQMEINKLRDDVSRLEKQCVRMQGEIEQVSEKKGFFKWKKIGIAALKSITGGVEKSVVEAEFGGRTPMMNVKTKSVKGRTPKRWSRSIS